MPRLFRLAMGVATDAVYDLGRDQSPDRVACREFLDWFKALPVVGQAGIVSRADGQVTDAGPAYVAVDGLGFLMGSAGVAKAFPDFGRRQAHDIENRMFTEVSHTADIVHGYGLAGGDVFCDPFAHLDIQGLRVYHVMDEEFDGALEIFEGQQECQGDNDAARSAADGWGVYAVEKEVDSKNTGDGYHGYEGCIVAVCIIAVF